MTGTEDATKKPTETKEEKAAKKAAAAAAKRKAKEEAAAAKRKAKEEAAAKKAAAKGTGSPSAVSAKKKEEDTEREKETRVAIEALEAQTRIEEEETLAKLEEVVSSPRLKLGEEDATVGGDLAAQFNTTAKAEKVAKKSAKKSRKKKGGGFACCAGAPKETDTKKSAGEPAGLFPWDGRDSPREKNDGGLSGGTVAPKPLTTESEEAPNKTTSTPLSVFKAVDGSGATVRKQSVKSSGIVERVKKGTVLEGTVLQDAKGHDWLEVWKAGAPIGYIECKGLTGKSYVEAVTAKKELAEAKTQLLENMDNLAALGDKTKEMEAGAKQFAANAKALAKSMGA